MILACATYWSTLSKERGKKKKKKKEEKKEGEEEGRKRKKEWREGGNQSIMEVCWGRGEGVGMNEDDDES